MPRYTPPAGPDDDLPDLRRRNPLVWWVAVIMAASMVFGTVAGTLVVLL
ncbi:MAG TPA: hypothetical protein VK866_11835 [Acidimicrobiales bacterium]|nr:hypothetical protein [Acidimicrobiales bacterium]